MPPVDTFTCAPNRPRCKCGKADGIGGRRGSDHSRTLGNWGFRVAPNSKPPEICCVSRSLDMGGTHRSSTLPILNIKACVYLNAGFPIAEGWNYADAPEYALSARVHTNRAAISITTPMPSANASVETVSRPVSA